MTGRKYREIIENNCRIKYKKYEKGLWKKEKIMKARI